MVKETALFFDDIDDFEDITLVNPSFFRSSDGIGLAYYCIKASNPISVLLFIHGGGAYSNARYQYMAKRLSEHHNISVYLLDIRGHGNSEGPRGDCPSPAQIFKDLQLIMDFVKKDNPQLPLFLGGHSSGAGLILNYLKWHNSPGIKGCIFLSPQLGYKSKTARKENNIPFAKVNLIKFVLYSMTHEKLFRHSPAVFFNYPEKILKAQPLFITSISCHMSTALTPNNPQKQFSEIDQSFGLFIGEEDELFDPEKVIYYGNLPKETIKTKSCSQIINKQNHLSILKVADEFIAETIRRIISL